MDHRTTFSLPTEGIACKENKLDHGKAWSSLVEGYEQLDRTNSQTLME